MCVLFNLSQFKRLMKNQTKSFAAEVFAAVIMCGCAQDASVGVSANLNTGRAGLSACPYADTTCDKAQKVSDVPLWPKGKVPAPNSDKPYAEKISENGGIKNVSISSVPEPSYALYKLSSKSPAGLVIVCPGGGYSMLAYTKEGSEIALELNRCGVSAMVLKYRVPNNPKGALQDIQRAIRIARANAKKWNINPDKIAVMGFSAGANLAARASTLYMDKSYEPVDTADSISARPDGTILIYPAYCDEPGYEKRWKGSKKQVNPSDYAAAYALAEDLKVDSNTPNAFIVQTIEDKYYVNASVAYALALKSAGVGADFHLFNEGPHGYGLRNKDNLVRIWPELLCRWLNYHGYTEAK